MGGGGGGDAREIRRMAVTYCRLGPMGNLAGRLDLWLGLLGCFAAGIAHIPTPLDGVWNMFAGQGEGRVLLL